MGVADTSTSMTEACDALIQSINQSRGALGYSETGGQAATLDHLVSALQDAADNLRTAGVAASLESAAPSLAQINNAVKQCNAVVAKLKAANAMITLAGSFVSLAAAVACGNIGDIATSAAAVVSEATKV